MKLFDWISGTSMLMVCLVNANPMTSRCRRVDSRPQYTLMKCKDIQKQMSHPNAVYVIDSNLNLKSKVIVIPEGCSLVFQKKGKLVNGIIVGSQTEIQAEKRTVFENVSIDSKGTWRTCVSYPEWFGASSNPSLDSKMAIQNAIDVADTCVLSQKYYTSYDTPTGRGDDSRVCAIAVKNKCIKGMPGNKLYVDAKLTNTERTSVFWVGDNVTIDGVNIEFINEEHSGWTGVQAGVYRVQGGNVKIENTTLHGAMAAWINLIGQPGRENFIIRNNFVHDCDCGLIIQGNQHTAGEVYSIKLLMEANVIEKEKERHSEFVSFWGSCKDGGIVNYTDVTIKDNHFSGGTKGGCITGHPERNGLKNVVITDNSFYDCGACSFYNCDGLVYKRNYVTGSTFVERQVKKEMGSYPNLAFYNCKNCTIDNNSCFGLSVENCQNMKIGKLKQTLGMKADDPFLLQQPAYVTNFIGVRARNSTILIDELTINPFDDDEAYTDLCRYYVSKIEGSDVRVKKTISTIPIQVSAKRVNMGEKIFKVKEVSKNMYIEMVK